MVLIVTDLPAPLSPTRAVTIPAGTVKSTLVSAWTAPNDLLTPRSSKSGTPSVMCTPWADLRPVSRELPDRPLPAGKRVGPDAWADTTERAGRSTDRYGVIPAAVQSLAY